MRDASLHDTSPVRVDAGQIPSRRMHESAARSDHDDPLRRLVRDGAIGRRTTLMTVISCRDPAEPDDKPMVCQAPWLRALSR
jgi:hypothetical protein